MATVQKWMAILVQILTSMHTYVRKVNIHYNHACSLHAHTTESHTLSESHHLHNKVLQSNLPEQENPLPMYPWLQEQV